MLNHDVQKSACTDEKFVTVEIIAKFLSVPVGTVYKMCLDGSLPSYKIGKLRRLKFSEVKDVLNQCKVAVCPVVTGVNAGETFEIMYFHQIGLRCDEEVDFNIQAALEVGIHLDVDKFCDAAAENSNDNNVIRGQPENLIIERRTISSKWGSDIQEVSSSKYFRLGILK